MSSSLDSLFDYYKYPSKLSIRCQDQVHQSMLHRLQQIKDIQLVDTSDIQLVDTKDKDCMEYAVK